MPHHQQLGKDMLRRLVETRRLQHVLQFLMFQILVPQPRVGKQVVLRFQNMG